MSDRPMVSFIVLAYQQERFIREAVRSALAQTYQPLEIVLSDDCSKDETFAIMCEEAKAYRGPHSVVLRRGAMNSGLAGHINQAWASARGEFMVMQAGDDSSLPERTTELVDAWKQSGSDLVYSEFSVMGAESEPITSHFKAIAAPRDVRQAIEDGWCVASGCSCGYSRELISRFGPLDGRVVTEDVVFPFRALLGHGISFVDKPLVRYRVHGSSISNDMGFWLGPERAKLRARQQKVAVNRCAVSQEWLRAWDLSGRQEHALRKKLVTLANHWQLETQCYQVSRLAAMGLVVGALAKGLPIRRALGFTKRHVLRYG